MGYPSSLDSHYRQFSFLRTQYRSRFFRISGSDDTVRVFTFDHTCGSLVADIAEGDKITVDQKNGYAVYESRDGEDLLMVEMCYWNEADQKHKLFAYNVKCYDGGRYSPGQFDGLTFYRYDNATKKMTLCEAPGFEVAHGTEDGAWVSYDLPRSGKDIIYTEWKGNAKKQKTLKWNGRRFR